MAKKKSRNWTDVDASSYDALFDVVTSEAKKRFGGQIFSGGEEACLLICLPVPSLSVRYLLRQEGWPLGRFTMVVGEQECCKSSFLYEVIRWHRKQKGKGVLIDNETKPAPELFWSILNYEYRAAEYQKCKTLDGWNEALNYWIQTFKERMDGAGGKDKGYGRIAPICYGVDSLTAALDAKEYGRLVKEGVPEKHFADVAAMLTDYIRMVTKEIDDYPFSLIGINHLKAGQTKTGLPMRNIAGGKGLRFHQATEIELRRRSSINPTAKSGQIRRIEDENIVEGIDLQLCTMKNSNAPHEFVNVEMLWYTDFSTQVEMSTVDEDGEIRKVMVYPQRTFFDWHSTSVEIILDILKERTRQARMLSDVLVIEGGADRRYCSSPTLGVSNKDKISWREMGTLLEEKLQSDSSFRDALYPILGIQRRYMYRPGIDYRELMAEAARLGFAADTGEETSGEKEAE